MLSIELLQKLCTQRDQIVSALPERHRLEYRSQGSLVNFGDQPEFAHLISHAEILQLLQALDFNDIRWLAGYLISKPAKSPALFWHQDWRGWDHRMSYQTGIFGPGVMIYLTDTGKENGCLRVIPGSHRCRHPLHDLPKAHEKTLSTFAQPGDVAYQSDASEVAVSVKLGDVVLMDPRLLHGAYANNSIGALIPEYDGDSKPYVWNRLPNQELMLDSWGDS